MFSLLPDSITGLSYYSFVILPFLIFCARVMDQSIGTLRIIFVARGKKSIATLLGFFESLIWIVVVSEIFSNIDNITTYFAYAAGFAGGNFVGILIEEKLAMGDLLVTIITPKDVTELIWDLNARNIGTTRLEGQGFEAKVAFIHTVCHRKDIDMVMDIIKKHDPNAFFTIKDIKTAARGVFPKNMRKKFPSLRAMKGK